MRVPRLPFPILAIGCLLLMLVAFWPVQNTLATVQNYEVDIATSPASGFLQAPNMAPGDTVTSVLQVQNNGTIDFNTTVSARLEAGADAYYNVLHLRVYDSQGEVFDGGFQDLQDFPVGTIAHQSSKNLTFVADLPLTAGNEMQGQTATVAFDFTAVGHDEEVPDDCCFEPPFSNSQFTLHQKSTVPIKFHLRSATGALETVPRSNVRLEVTGPGANGSTVKYLFAVSDGSLKFDNSLHEPHYLARFSTFDDPVQTDGWYTATVYDGSTALCQKTFQVLKQGNRSNAPY